MSRAVNLGETVESKPITSLKRNKLTNFIFIELYRNKLLSGFFFRIATYQTNSSRPNLKHSASQPNS